jgi:HSP20 family molecular chaperone IbpA
LTLKDKPIRPEPSGRIKSLLDGMAARQAAMIQSAVAPMADLPVAVTMDRDWFRAEFAIEGVDPSNVTFRVDGQQLVVTIGLGGGFERDDERMRRIEASGQIWERSFKLDFKPSLAAVRATVEAKRVIVEAARARSG